MAQGNEGRPKILIVDDDPTIIELLDDRLSAAGFKIVAAFDAIQAVAVAHKEGPDLVILDVMLPGGSAFTVLERLRTASPTALIPVIAVSGLGADEIVERLPRDQVEAADEQIAHFAQKPLDFDDLIAKIHEILAG